MLLPVNLMLINHQHRLHVFKQKIYIKQGAYYLVNRNTLNRGLQEPNPVFPPGANGSVSFNSAFTAILYNFATNNENWLH